MDGSLLLWLWFIVVSLAVRLDFVNYYLESCRSLSTGLICLNNLLSCANVNSKIDFSSVPDSQIVHRSVPIWVWTSGSLWTAGSWDATPAVLGETNLSCFVNTCVFLGCLCLPYCAGLWGKLSSSFFPSLFHLSCPLCVLLSLLSFPNCQFAQ